MSSTIGTDTELSAVNSILGSIGQAPVNTLGTLTSYNNQEIATYENPEVSFIYNILREVNVDVQNEGWVFNRENDVELSPETSTGFINYPADALRIDVSDNSFDRSTNIVKREGKLYDKVHKSYVFDKAIKVNIVRIYDFDDLPSVFQRYITARASTRAATQLVANPQLVQLLGQQEAFARAACMEYECNQSDANYMGFPDNTSYRTYQPYNALRR
jgi:hypothetical protein